MVKAFLYIAFLDIIRVICALRSILSSIPSVGFQVQGLAVTRARSLAIVRSQIRESLK